MMRNLFITIFILLVNLSAISQDLDVAKEYKHPNPPIWYIEIGHLDYVYRDISRNSSFSVGERGVILSLERAKMIHRIDDFGVSVNFNPQVNLSALWSTNISATINTNFLNAANFEKTSILGMTVGIGYGIFVSKNFDIITHYSLISYSINLSRFRITYQSSITGLISDDNMAAIKVGLRLFYQD